QWSRGGGPTGERAILAAVARGPGTAAGRAHGRLPDGRAPSRHGLRDGARPRPAALPQRAQPPHRRAVRRGPLPRRSRPGGRTPPGPAYLLRPDRLPRAPAVRPPRRRDPAHGRRPARRGPARAAPGTG